MKVVIPPEKEKTPPHGWLTENMAFFCLPVPPMGNARKTGAIKKSSSGKQYVGVRVKNEYKLYQAMCYKLAFALRAKSKTKPWSKCLIGVKAQWYRKNKKGDIDAIWKDIYDGFEKSLYENDSAIKKQAHEWFDTDPKNARVEIFFKVLKNGKR